MTESNAPTTPTTPTVGLGQVWPAGCSIDSDGALTFHGRSAQSLIDEFGSPLYVMDTDDIDARAHHFVHAAATAFPNATTHVSFAAKAFMSKEVLRLVTNAGMLVDTCTMGEMRIALAAGVPGRRLVLHGNNKSDEEIELAIREGFAKIVVDAPDEPARIARIAHRLGKTARVMLRVTTGIHAGGHEYISTAHEDQKFGMSLLPAGTDPSALNVLDDLIAQEDEHTPSSADATAHTGQDTHTVGHSGQRDLQYDMRSPYDLDASGISKQDAALAEAMDLVARGPALAVLKDLYRYPGDLELVGIHSHIGSQIHDANAFIEAAKRMMLLRKTFYATDAYTLPEVDLGGGYSVAYTEGEDSMDIDLELGRLASSVTAINRALGMPMPVISFEPGRWIVAPTCVTLYRVGAIKHVGLPEGTTAKDGSPISERIYVSVDGGMSDNIRPALYDADYTARVANRRGSADTMLSRVVGIHCESGDILVHECQLPADLKRGDILAVPVTGAYGRAMASNYNQALFPAVVAVSSSGAHVMLRRQTIDDLLGYDLG